MASNQGGPGDPWRVVPATAGAEPDGRAPRRHPATDDRADDRARCLHGKLHFASSRATIWLADDPWAYRILGIDELSDPDICLAYPRRPTTERAIVAPEHIAPVFEMFRRLRFADDTIYLRVGSLNICNGMIGLNFSCDGSHYLPYDEFLDKGLEFWFGAPGS